MASFPNLNLNRLHGTTNHEPMRQRPSQGGSVSAEQQGCRQDTPKGTQSPSKAIRIRSENIADYSAEKVANKVVEEQGAIGLLYFALTNSEKKITELVDWLNDFHIQFNNAKKESGEMPPLVIVFGDKFSRQERNLLLDAGAQVHDRSVPVQQALADLEAKWEAAALAAQSTPEPVRPRENANPNAHNQQPSWVSPDEIDEWLQDEGYLDD